MIFKMAFSIKIEKENKKLKENKRKNSHLMKLIILNII